MGIPLKAFNCKNELRTDSVDDNSDEVLELSPVIFWLKFTCVLLETHSEEEEKH